MQASIGGKTLNTSKIEKPKFNLFNFQKPTPIATIGGVGITQKAPVQASITPTRQVTPVSNTPTQKPIQGRGATNLFIDEQEALQKMLDAGLNENKAKEVITERRKSLLSEISQEESVALTKMIQAGLDSEKAVELVKQNRNQNLPAWKKVAKFGFDATVGSLGMVSEQVGNVGGFLGAEGMQETGREIRDITTRTTGDSLGAKTGEFITGAGEILATSPAKIPATLLGRIGQGAVVGGYQGATMPILEKGNEVTAGDITQGGLVGGAVGAIAVPVFEKGLKAVEKGIQKGVKYGTAGYQGGITGLGKSIGRDVKAGIMKPFQTKAQEKAGNIAMGGLINPAKLDAVKRGLQVEEGVATPQDVGKWMLNRVKPGSKQEIADQLIAHSEKSKKAVDESLLKISERFKNDSAKKALNQIINDLEGRVGFEDDVVRIQKLLDKKDYSLSELNAVKREMDKIYNIYKQSGEVSASLNAQGLNKVRQDIRKFIEDQAKTYGVDIRKLNNETSVARGLAEGIMKKDNADSVREFLSAFAPSGVGSVIGAGQSVLQGNDPLIVLRDAIIGGVTARVLTSTKVRTTIANKINKLGPKEMSALEKYIKTGGADEVGKKVAEKVLREANIKNFTTKISKNVNDNLNRSTSNNSSVLLKQKLLPAGKKSPIITPQTLDKARILESKAELSKAKIVNPQKVVEKRLTPKQVQEVKAKVEATKPKIVNNKPVPKSEVNKPVVKKSLDNKGGYINPSAIVDDITKAIKTLTPKNITQLSVQIASKLKVSVSKVQAILKEYVQKYGAELKNKAGDLFDDLVDRLGVRSKLVDGKGTGISGKIDAPKELIEEAKKVRVFLGTDNKNMGIVKKELGIDSDIPLLTDINVPKKLQGKGLGTQAFFDEINSFFKNNKGVKYFGTNQQTPDGVAFFKALEQKGYIEKIKKRKTDSSVDYHYIYKLNDKQANK